jgi:parvulin-like peptidyl-prolyl isomerase
MRCLVAFGLLALTLGCGQEQRNAWIARVDGREVPIRELHQRAEPRLADVSAGGRAAVYAEELERLLADQLVLNRAEKLGVGITDEEVSARIQLVHGSSFELPDAGYREQVRQQMILERTVLLELSPRARIPEDQLIEHFEQTRERYAVPPRIQVRQIVVDERARAEELHELLLTGADFVSRAREYSLAPEAARGGLLPPFALGEMPEVFDRAFDLDVGQFSDVIQSDYGFHIFLLIGKLPPHQPELGEVREEILVALQRERLDELRRSWLRELRLAADIEINERLLRSLQ